MRPLAFLAYLPWLAQATHGNTGQHYYFHNSTTPDAPGTLCRVRQVSEEAALHRTGVRSCQCRREGGFGPFFKNHVSE